jgi:hypothetical protein
VQGNGMESAPLARGRRTATGAEEAVGVMRLGRKDSLREEALSLRPGCQALVKPLPVPTVTGE